MASTCQVDFYVLQDERQSAELLACRLALMAWEHGNRIMVITESAAVSQRVDQLMWDQPQGRFLPHAIAGDNNSAPVGIGFAEQLEHAQVDLVINLTDTAISTPNRFQRLLELVPASEAQRAASREKFREYRANGLDPVSHPMNRN